MTIVVWVFSLSVTPLTGLFLSSLFFFLFIICLVFARHVRFLFPNCFLIFSGNCGFFPDRLLRLSGNFRVFLNRSSSFFFPVRSLRLSGRYRFLSPRPFSFFCFSRHLRVSFRKPLAGFRILGKPLSFSGRLWIFLSILLAFSSRTFAKDILVSGCVMLHQRDRLVDLTELL